GRLNCAETDLGYMTEERVTRELRACLLPAVRCTALSVQLGFVGEKRALLVTCHEQNS
ncbi:hypothetical protein AVEN_123472-1, partial [Araneus ventricosus]